MPQGPQGQREFKEAGTEAKVYRQPHSLFPTLEAARVPLSSVSLRSYGAGSSEEEEGASRMSRKRPAWLCSAPHRQPQGSQAVHFKPQPPAPKDGSEETFSVLHWAGLFFLHTRPQFPDQIPLITPYQAMKIQFLTSYLPLSAFCSLGHPDLRAFALDYLPGKAGLFVI